MLQVSSTHFLTYHLLYNEYEGNTLWNIFNTVGDQKPILTQTLIKSLKTFYIKNIFLKRVLCLKLGLICIIVSIPFILGDIVITFVANYVEIYFVKIYVLGTRARNSQTTAF